MKKLKLFLVLMFSFTLNVFAQSNTPDPDWWITNGFVNTILVDGGYTYIGGNFTYVGPNTGYGAKLTTTSDDPDMTFPKVNGIINVAIPDGIGGWLIGGTFTRVGTYDRNRIARINSDGSVDPNWDPNANNTVETIFIYGNNIYVGGQFTNIGDQPRNRIARLNNTNGDADTWNPIASNTVSTIAIDGSDVYVGGSFTTIGGQSRNRIAKLNNIDGTADPTWNPNASSTINTITISGNDIYVGGQFTTIGGQSRNRIAKLNNTDGTADLTWNPNANNIVETIFMNGSDIYVGGSFTTIGGQARNRIARINSDGTVDLTWNPNASGIVNTIAISGSDIYCGGVFNTIGGQSMNRIAKLNITNGNADPTWDPNAGGVVNTLALSGSDIYIGGAFVAIGGLLRSHIAKIDNTNGTVDPTWNPNPQALVNTIAKSGNSIYVGGGFSSIGGQLRNRIAKLNDTDGSAEPIWNPNVNAGGLVYKIALDGSDIYVGGLFTTIGGQPRNRIAMLNDTDGAADLTWNPNASATVYEITIDGSDIYVGGSFTTIGGQSRNRIARLNNTNGDADSWDPNASIGVDEITISGNNIYVGGGFTTIGGQSRNRIAKLNNIDGSADPLWNPNANNPVKTIVISGSDIYVGGTFTTIGGQPRNGIVKLNNTNGDADPTWDPDLGIGGVNTIAESDNDIYVGGNFSSIGGNFHPNLALFKGTTVLNTQPSFISPTPACGTQFTIDVGQPFNFTVTAEDIDVGDVVTISVTGLPLGSVMNPGLPVGGNPVSSEFSWTPDLASVGNYTVTFEITDNHSAPVSCSFTIEVNELSVPPSFVSPSPECGTTLMVDEGSLISFTISAEDANSGNLVLLSVSGLPAGSSMDPSLPLNGNPVSSVFSWTPSPTDAGIHTIVFTADDNENDPVICSLLVEVIPIPPPQTNYCPLSQGYWKNHSSNWPASALLMMLGTLNEYNQSELLSLFNSAPRGDASIILAHQLIAAKLNVANGSPVPIEVTDAISDADDAIGTLVIPAGIKGQHPLRETMIDLASLLDDYNNQLLTPNCVQMPKNGSGELEPVTEYALFSNFPNPFNPTTKISWQTPVDGMQTLKVYDVLGKEVAVLVDEFRPAGRYEAIFDAKNLASGIYIYRLQAGDFVQTKKMILMK